MKVLKTLTCSMAAAAALAFCASSAKATTTNIVGHTEDFSKVNITMTIVTNAPEIEKGNSTNYVDTYKTGSAAINNKTLIALFASWSTNSLSTWQSEGAQLIFDWNSYQLCVADKSGTNILFYTDDYEDAYVNFRPTSEDGANTGTETESKNGVETDNGNETYYAYLNIYYYDDVDADYISLTAHGIDDEKYSNNYPVEGPGTWTGTDSVNMTGWGEFKGDTATITSFKATLSGKGIND